MERKPDATGTARVLILEDDGAQLRTLSAIVRAEGFEVVGCTTAAEALRQLGQHPFDVGIIDLGLPDVANGDLLERLRQADRSVSLIIHTGRGSYDSARMAVNAGVFAYVEKGGDPRELVGQLHRAIHARMKRFTEDLEREVAVRTRELKDLYRTLEESQQRLQRVIQGSHDGIWEWRDLSQDQYWWSPRFFEMLGYEDCEFSPTAEVFYDLLHPDDRERVQGQTQAMIDRVGPFDVEYRLRTKSNSYIWVQARGQTLRDANGQPYCMSGTIRDLTEKKNAEAAIRRSESLFRCSFDDAAIGMAISDLNGNFTQVNESVCRMLGYSKQEMLGFNFCDITHPDDRETSAARFRDLLSGNGKTYTVDKRYHRKDGQVVWGKLTVSLVSGAEGKPPFVAAQLQDITEQKRSEELLRHSERWFRSLIELSASVYAVVDVHGIIVYQSPSVERWFGWKQDELVGTSCFVHMHPDDLNRVRASLEEIVKDPGAVKTEELRFRHKDGSWRWLSVVGANHINDPAVQGIVLSYQDVTERKQAEEEVRKHTRFHEELVDSLPNPVFWKGLDGRYLGCNGAFADFVGVSKEEIIGKTVADIAPGELAAEYREMDEKLFDQAKSQVYETTVVRPDGTERHVIFHKAPLTRPDGSQFGLVGVAIDITERKHAEEAVATERRRFQQMLDSFPYEIYIAGKDHHVEYANLPMRREFGNPGDRKCHVYLHDLPDPCPWCPNEKVLRGEVVRWEWHSPKNDRVYEVVDIPFHNDDGTTSKLEVFQDVTESRKAAKAIRESELRFRSIFSQTFQLAGILTADGIMTAANTTALQFIGASETNVVGKPFWDTPWWRHSPELQGWLRGAVTSVARGATIRREVTHLSAKGEVHYFDFSLKPVVGDDGAVLYLIPESRDITDRKRTEQAIKEAKEYTDNIISAMADILLVISPQGTIEKANPTACRLLEYPEADLIGKPAHELFQLEAEREAENAGERTEEESGQDRLWQRALPFQRRVVRRLVKEGSFNMVEQSLRTGSGDLVAALLSGALIRNDDQIQGVVCLASDITQRKRSEEDRAAALMRARRRESETAELLKASRAVLDCTCFKAAAQAIFDSCKKVLGATAGYVALLSEDGQENEVLFLDSGDRQCTVDPDLPMPVRGLRSEAYRTKQVTYENHFASSRWQDLMPDGHMDLDNVLFSPLVISGDVVGLIGLANKPEGFTEHDAEIAGAFGEFAAIALRNVRAEESLAEATQRLELALRAGNIGLWDWNLITDDVYFSPEWKAQIGFADDEIENSFETWESRLAPEDRERILERQHGYLDGSSPEYAVEFRFRHKDGSYRWIYSKGEALRDERGKPIRMLGCHVDITDSRKAQVELARARDAAEAANRAKSEFLANMSHEIRTPMTAITGFTELLLSRQRSPEEQHDHLTTIHRNAQNLLAIINDILDLSKIEAERIEVEPVDRPLRGIVDEVQALLGDAASEKGLPLTVKYIEPLPSTVHTDPGKLRQILINLVGNAIKFTDQGGVGITVRSIVDEERGMRVQFAISDTGIGMTEEETQRLFRPFTQVDMSSTRRFGGTGLGLSISQRLAEKLGGRIDVRSEPGAGSTFTLTIDAGLAANRPASTREDRGEQPMDSTVPSRYQGRVLLAEDAPDMVKLVRSVLIEVGLEPDVAENGRAAVEKARASKAHGTPYDLILMDIRMPVMDGFEATRRLRKDGWDGPIVALTANAMRGDREEGLSAGCDDFLAKPVRQDAFLQVLDRYLGPEGRITAAEMPPTGQRESNSSEPLFDGLLDDSTAAQLLQEYAEALPAKVDALTRALETRNLERLGVLGHELKGVARMYGFPEVSDKARRLQQLAETAEDLAGVEKTVLELIQLCRAAAAGQQDRSAP